MRMSEKCNNNKYNSNNSDNPLTSRRKGKRRTVQIYDVVLVVGGGNPWH